jgi:hypothetical protein
MIGPDPGPAYILLELISGGRAPKSSTGVTPLYEPQRKRRRNDEEISVNFVELEAFRASKPPMLCGHTLPGGLSGTYVKSLVIIHSITASPRIAARSPANRLTGSQTSQRSKQLTDSTFLSVAVEVDRNEQPKPKPSKGIESA